MRFRFDFISNSDTEFDIDASRTGCKKHRQVLQLNHLSHTAATLMFGLKRCEHVSLVCWVTGCTEKITLSIKSMGHFRPQSEATDTVIIGILLALARTSGPTQHAGCVRVLCQEYSITEISEVGVQLPDWHVTLHLRVCMTVYLQVWQNGCTR